MRLGYWMKGWAKDCPYNPGDIVNNLDVVRGWKNQKTQRASILWEPPPVSKMKWNVGGSAKGKPGRAGIGGILRDDNGVIKAKFSAFIGIKDSNEAEFRAIIFALELSLQNPETMQKEIIIESDSRIALTWVSKLGECPWKLRFLGNKLRNLVSLLKVTFEHKNREANDLVDALAKEGSESEQAWIQWLDPYCSNL